MRDERVGKVFAALGDPTRRRVVDALTMHGPMTATALAGRLPVSRQAVAKHLQTLAEAGLVTTERRGRELLYRLTPAPMAEAMSWMATAGAEWDDRIARLKRLIGDSIQPIDKLQR